MIYKIRAIADTEDDIFRDIAIQNDASLEDLHNAIVNSFGFDGTEAASFYTCDDEWNQEDEIPLFDTGDVPGEMRTMNDFKLEDLLYEDQTKIIYVYDFFNMWTFFVELAAIEEPVEGENYPALLFAHGALATENREFRFSEDEEEIFGSDYEDDFDDEDFDIFDGDDSFEDFGQDDQW